MSGRTLLIAGVLYGLFVTAGVYWLGGFLEVSGSVPVRVAFAVGVGILASLVFFFAYLMGRNRKD